MSDKPRNRAWLANLFIGLLVGSVVYTGFRAYDHHEKQELQRDLLMITQGKALMLKPQCHDDDGRCSHDAFCDRDRCMTEFTGDPLYPRLHMCNGDYICKARNGAHFVCLRGRCRSCIKDEECGPGFECNGITTSSLCKPTSPPNPSLPAPSAPP